MIFTIYFIIPNISDGHLYKDNQGVKEPNVKLIPSDPMTNSILIIYCVSSGGVSVPFKSQWRRINKKRNLV